MGRLAKVTLEKCAINGRERCGCGWADGRMSDLEIYMMVDCARLRRLGSSPNLCCPISRGNWVACGLLKRTIGGGGERETLQIFFPIFLSQKILGYSWTSGLRDESPRNSYVNQEISDIECKCFCS